MEELTMKFTFTRPDCGKVHDITMTEAKATPVTLITKKEQATSWAEIANNIRTGKGQYAVGDEITCKLKDNTEVTFVAVATNPYSNNEVAFILKDCLGRHCFNEKNTNKGGWRDSDIRAYLNNEVYDLLPDDLKSVIKVRTITQHLDGEELVSKDKLWLPSLTEVTGEDWAGSDSEDDVHFEYFKDEKSRVKQLNNETTWWWLRSPYSDNSTQFCAVTGTGTASHDYATGGYSVAFSFLI
jgi:hypothetical protein